MAPSVSSKCASYLNYLDNTSGSLILRGYNEGLTDSDVDLIVDRVHHHPSLSTLIIDGTPLFTRGFAFYWETEEELNHVEDRFVHRMVTALNGHSSLTQLVMVRLHSTAMTWNSLAQLLNETPSLTEFSLKDTLLSECDFDAFCLALSSHSTLRSLSLSGSLEPNLVQMFSTALAVNTSLQRLDLSRNCWVRSSLPLLFQALHSNQTVTMLDLSQMHIPFFSPGLEEETGCELGELLGDVLERNTSLQQLKVTGSEPLRMEFSVSRMGAERLIAALSVNTTLTQLDLADVKIVDMNEILQSLHTQSTLRDLDLRMCNVGHQGLEPLRFSVVCDLIKQNSSLTALNLSECRYGDPHPDQYDTDVRTAVTVNGSLLRFNGSTATRGLYSPELERNLHNTALKAVTLYELLLPFLYLSDKREITEISDSSSTRSTGRSAKRFHGSSSTGQGSWT